tara:strand:- start:433 stop:999 length:567 start_codon:yes stop_codon:yes gene_type:complete
MYEYLIKRPFDFIFAFFSLIILLPIFPIVFLLIKFFDNGPIIFRQYRVGTNNEKFIIYKFRSLPHGTKNVSSDKLKIDKISKVGKFLRRTSIDELPQLFNILKGDMSFVGPRPSLISQEELIYLRNKNRSIGSKPGLTGLAQIKGFTGMSISQKALYDEKYHLSKSFFLDLYLIISTIFYLIKKPPVY